MKTLPRLFDDEGKLLPDIDVSGVDDKSLALLKGVRVAYYKNVEAQQGLDAASNEQSEAAEALSALQTHYDARWPRQTFFDLWKEAFGRGQ